MTPTIASISPEAFRKLCREGPITLIDVRTPAEFAEVHLVQAKNIPLDQLDPEKLKASSHAETVYVICRSGGRSKKACEKLSGAGIANAVNIEGGTSACELAGLPVIRGRKMISLMRQVQITVGSLGFLGSVLAMTVSEWFAGIPAFFCGGLLFAGLTDTCMLAMLLAKMPWNRRAGATTCQMG